MISRPPRMSIRQYMEGMLPCTAPYLLIRVTFSTPTGLFANRWYDQRFLQIWQLGLGQRGRRSSGSCVAEVASAYYGKLLENPADITRARSTGPRIPGDFGPLFTCKSTANRLRVSESRIIANHATRLGEFHAHCRQW